jgi:hypothetical protein
MSFLYTSGEGMNILTRAAAVKALTCSPAEDANFPVSNVCDGRPSAYFKPGSSASSAYVQADLNLVPDGDGEVTTLPSSWIATTGTLESSATQTYGAGGTRSIRVYNATAPTGYCDVRMRAGEKFRVYYAAFGSTGTASLKFTNLETGLDLTTAPAWGSGNLVSTGSAAWSSGYTTYTMPTVEEAGGYWQRCRITLAVSGAAGNGFFEVKVVPGWDTLAIFGHQSMVGSRATFAYQALSTNDPRDAWSSGTSVTAWTKSTSSTANPWPDTELTQPSIWNTCETRYERWVRYQMHGTLIPPGYGAIGELILCQSESVARNPRLQLSTSAAMPGQLRYETGAGDVWTYNRTANPAPRVTLRYATKSALATGDDSMYRAAYHLHVGRTHGGRWPTLVIPYENDPRLVVYGHMVNTLEVDHTPPLRSFEVEIQQLPIPGLHHGLSMT